MHSPSLPCNPSPPTARVARLIQAAFWGFVCAAIVAAPLLAAAGHSFLSSLVYLFFSPVCHQLPARSFSLSGFSWAVCQRCSGLYFGFFLSCFLPVVWLQGAARSRSRRWWVMAAGVPLLSDVLLSYLGLSESSGTIRFGTGLLAGAAVNLVVLPAVAEFFFETRRSSLFAARVVQNQGDPI